MTGNRPTVVLWIGNETNHATTCSTSIQRPRELQQIHDIVEEFATKAEQELSRKQEASRRSVLLASATMRSLRDDPRKDISLQARRRPFMRPLSKGRVCGSSSRYRTLARCA